jgi:DNA-binding GntR family transcriptional regulator
LVSHPNRGFFVRELSTREAEEVFALRLKIEPDAAAFACKAAGDEEQHEARTALKRLATAAEAHEPAVGALNRAFHLALVRPGGQLVTTNVVRGLHIIADRYVRKHLEPHYRHIQAESEHQEILDAWLKPDSRKVKQLLLAHLEHTLKDLRLQLAEDGVAGSLAPVRPAVPGGSARGADGKKKTAVRRRRSVPHSR